MFKKLKECYCYLDIACYCLDIDADFDQFQKECLKLNGGWNDIFVIKNPTRTPFRSIQLSYIACCKKFVNFQIDLFVKTESFPLRTIDCRYRWTRADVGFDYEDDNFIEIYYNSYDNDSNDSDDNDNNKQQTNPFASSACYTEMRSNLMFERFCLTCQDVFLVYFTRKLRILFSKKNKKKC